MTTRKPRAKKPSLSPPPPKTPEQIEADRVAAIEARAKSDAAYAARLAELRRGFKMPEVWLFPQTKEYQLGELYMRMQGKIGSLDGYDPDYNKGMVLGMPLPPFQRPAVWTREQQISFIESMWLGFPFGVYTANVVPDHLWFDHPKNKGRVENVDILYWHPFQDWIMDGQQRLRALQAYWHNEFPVFGSYWEDLIEREQGHLKSKKFVRAEIYLHDEDRLREAYNRMNFNGTAHTEEQRA